MFSKEEAKELREEFWDQFQIPLQTAKDPKKATWRLDPEPDRGQGTESEISCGPGGRSGGN